MLGLQEQEYKCQHIHPNKNTVQHPDVNLVHIVGEQEMNDADDGGKQDDAQSTQEPDIEHRIGNGELKISQRLEMIEQRI